MMRRQNQSGRRLFAAMAVAGWALLAAGPAAAQDPLLGSGEDPAAVFDKFKEPDAKLRASFREICLEYKRAVEIVKHRNAAQMALDNPRLAWLGQAAHERDFAQMTWEFQRVEAHIRGLEGRFKEDRAALAGMVNDEGIPAIRQLGAADTPQSAAALIKFTGMFLFDSKAEVPTLHVSDSFVDQRSWQEVVKALGARGMAIKGDLKKALQSTQSATRYAAIAAFGEMGPPADADKTIYAELIAQLERVRRSSLDRTERQQRIQLLETAMHKIRPVRK